MRFRKPINYCIILLLAASFLLSAVSCEKTQEIIKTDYYNYNADCSIRITEVEGTRGVLLNVAKRDGIWEASITEPSQLAGIKILSDAGGVRIVSAQEEIPLTAEAAAGITVFFDALSYDLSQVECESTDSGGAIAKFTIGGQSVELTLGDDAMPKSLDVYEGTYKRHVEIEKFEILDQ